MCEFHEACRYVYQILLIVTKDKVGNQRRIRLVIKEDVAWSGRADFAGKLFDSV